MIEALAFVGGTAIACALAGGVAWILGFWD